MLLVGLGGYALARAILEAGEYPSGHGFCLDGKAYRAYHEAQATRPGTHLVVETRGGFVGPDIYYQVHLSQEFDERDHVKLTTRGVPLVVEKYLYERHMLRPLISHNGGPDKTSGYSFRFRKE